MNIRQYFDKPKTGTRQILELFACVLICGFVSLWLVSAHMKVPITSLLSQIKRGYHFPYLLYYPPLEINHINFNVILFAIVFFAAGLAIFKETFWNRRILSWPQQCQIISISGFIVFAFILALHVVNHEQAFLKAKPFHEKASLEQEMILRHGLPYEFARYCESIFPGRHKGKLVTDLDISREPYMTFDRKLRYFFYPTIDLRPGDLGKIDCLVFVQKTNALELMPKDFEVRGMFKKDFILATKKETLPE